MRRLFFIMMAVLACTFGLSAQLRTFSGTVLDATNNEPLIGVTVAPVGGGQATSTDVDGNFILRVPQNVTKAKFTYVGYNPATVDLRHDMKIYLQSSDAQLDEVVVTGYGTTRKAAFTGAAAVMSGSDIDKRTEVNFVQALEGNVTGLQYNNSTSMPGMWGEVLVRGVSSLSSSTTPLYVIDGVPVNSDYDTLETTNNYFDPMAAYNPSDIESVTVLKDAAATAIYGSRAANGVIVITTKKGGEGKFQLDLDVKLGLTSVANNNMKYANAFETMDFFAKNYVNRYPTSYTYDTAYEYIKNYFEWDGVTDTNWMDEVTRTGFFQNYNLSFNGTNGSTHYFGSLGFLDTKGVVINSSNKRYNGRLNIDTSYKFLQVGLNASYSYTNNESFSQSTGQSYASPTVGAQISMVPMYPVYVTEDGIKRYFGEGSLYNPLAVNDPKIGNLHTVNNQTINANPWARITLPYGIWFKTNFGANIMTQELYDYWSSVTNPQGVKSNGRGRTHDSRTSTLTWTNTLGWNYTFGQDHQVDFLLGQEMQRYEYHYTELDGSDFPFGADGMRELATAGQWGDSEYGKSQSRMASYFADLHYSYASRYFISASVRRDGSSVFGEDSRWGNFWSIGGKWRLSQEKFLEDNTVLTNLALRISYGTVGNQSLPSLYASRGYYAAGYNYDGGAGITPYQIANPRLTWETSKKFDVGLDFSLINRIHFTFDYYNDITDDALYQVPITMTTGFDTYYKNIGKLDNRGIELGVNGAIYTGRDVTVNGYVNLSWNKNKVKRLYDGNVVGTYTIIEEGRPYHQWYMKEFAGVDPETGKAQYYKNETGDELTTVYAEAAQRYVGSSDPKLIGAFGFSATGYGFDASIAFNFRTGNKVFNYGLNGGGWSMNWRTPLKYVVDNAWTEDNRYTDIPQYKYGDPDKFTSRSSAQLMSGDYLRLSNITFGYTFPKKITRAMHLRKLRLYTTFDNVHTWVKKNFHGFTPDTYGDGYIAAQYPGTFTFTGGVQVSF
ncbi:MAG: SusC/RagA family TonB-linked outer membrane protein [Muribaculaceae bacterium]|nr:SusC/RagA family TonB-linked outer membrane protein [Muribaculaceae bacterium]